MSRPLPYEDSDAVNASYLDQVTQKVNKVTLPDAEKVNKVTGYEAQGKQKVTANTSFELELQDEVTRVDLEVTKPMMQVTKPIEPEPLPLGVYELHINRESEKESVADVEAFVGSIDYTFPTQALIRLENKYNSVKSQKARVKASTRLNVFEKEEQLAGYARKLAFLTSEINKVKKKLNG